MKCFLPITAAALTLAASVAGCQHSTSGAGHAAASSVDVARPAAFSSGVPLHRGSVSGLTFGSRGRSLAFASDDVVKVLALPSEEVLLQGHREGAPLSGLGLGSEGQMLVGGAGHTIFIWDGTAEAPERLSYTAITGTSAGGGPMTDFALGPQGVYAVTSGSAGTGGPRLVLWNVAERRIASELAKVPQGTKPMNGSGKAVAFSPSGDRVAVAVQPEGAVQVWSVPGGTLLTEFALPPQTAETSDLAFSPDGRLLAAANVGYSEEKGWYPFPLQLWNVEEGRELLDLEAPTRSVHSVSFSPAGGRVLTGSADGSIRLRDLESGALIRTLTGHQGTVRALAFSPEGDMFASGGDEALRLWSLRPDGK